MNRKLRARLKKTAIFLIGIVVVFCHYAKKAVRSVPKILIFRKADQKAISKKDRKE